MNQSDPTLALLRRHVLDILIGPIFSFVGLAACGIAAIRRRGEFRLLLWSGLFIGMYGVRLLAQTAGDLALAPFSPWPRRLGVFIAYMSIVPGFLFWAELSLGALRKFFQGVTFLSFVVGLVGLGYFAMTGSPDKLLTLNAILAISMLSVLGVMAGVPLLRKKYLVLENWVFAVGLPAIVVVSLYYNAARLMGFRTAGNIEPEIFMAWILALGYVAVQRVFVNERRLLTIESELQTARQIQFSTLPDCVPSIENLRIAALYQPMSAVAGDFYQFIPFDQHHLGVLVADVSGHGVPAALISSMMKVAMQSVVASAADPAEVLRSLNRILSPELRGQLISAAYLWLDTSKRCARYSAAGHPPLLCWRDTSGQFQQIESNGLLFGVNRESDYPVCDLPLNPSDRFLIYTDGMIEPENAAGEAFGDRQLEQVMRRNRSQPASVLAENVLSDLRRWRPASAAQQDDITLIVIEVL